MRHIELFLYKTLEGMWNKLESKKASIEQKTVSTKAYFEFVCGWAAHMPGYTPGDSIAYSMVILLESNSESILYRQADDVTVAKEVFLNYLKNVADSEPTERVKSYIQQSVPWNLLMSRCKCLSKSQARRLGLLCTNATNNKRKRYTDCVNHKKRQNSNIFHSPESNYDVSKLNSRVREMTTFDIIGTSTQPTPTSHKQCGHPFGRFVLEETDDESDSEEYEYPQCLQRNAKKPTQNTQK